MRRLKLACILVLPVMAGLMTSCATATVPRASSRQNVAADKTLAGAANLVLTDFPTGWAAAPPVKTKANPQDLLDRIQSCFHHSLAALDSHGPTRVTSPVFSDAEHNTVLSTVDYRATGSQVEAAFRLYQNPRYIGCVKSVIGASLKNTITHGSTTIGTGVTVGAISLNNLALPRYGDQSLANRILVPILYQGQPAGSEFFDDVVVRQGRAFAAVEFTGSSVSSFSSSLEQHLVSVVVGRLVKTGDRAA
jgi:hypothetical protein